MMTYENLAEHNTELILTSDLNMAKANKISAKYAELISDYWTDYLYFPHDLTKEYGRMMAEAKKYGHSYEDTKKIYFNRG
jgi:hypothetical protein